jgi:flagellar biosynthetic protein FliR
MDLLGLNPGQFESLILIFVRISIVLFMFPFFGGIMVPNTVKAGLALMITIVLFPVVEPNPDVFPRGLLASGNMILSELVLGLVVGLVARFFFAAIQLGGQLVGYQMGFAIANVFDPESGNQGSILAQMGYWVAIVFFLLLDGHHILLRTLRDSFAVIEVGTFGIGNGMVERITQASGEMFSMAIRIGAPAIAALLLTSAAFGVIAKVVPQMNILIVAFPLKIVVGLFFFGFSLEILLHFTKAYLTDFPDVLRLIMRLAKV